MAANRLNIRHLGRFDLTFDDCTAAALAAWLLVVTLPITFVQGSSSRMIALIAILPVGLGDSFRQRADLAAGATRNRSLFDSHWSVRIVTSCVVVGGVTFYPHR